MRSLFNLLRRRPFPGRSSRSAGSQHRPRTRPDERPTRGNREPPLDLYRTRKFLVLECDVPGVKKHDLDVELTGDRITICGERRKEKDLGASPRNYHRTERLFDTFERTVGLPEPVQGDRARARYENGVLRVRLPREKSRKDIPVT